MARAAGSGAVRAGAGGGEVKPYYEDAEAGIVIYHADCRDVLPTMAAESVDLVLTDPPFFLPAHIETSRRNWPRRLADLSIMSFYFQGLFQETTRVLSASGALYTFADSTSYAVFLSCLYPLFDRTQCIVWDKGRGGMGNGWRHSTELIIHGAWAATTYTEGFRRDVIQRPVVSSAKRVHPSEKPLSVILSLLDAHSPGMVLDPFMGTGTTLLGARQRKWKAAGIEFDERNCEIAARRLAQMAMPLTDDPAVEPTQAEMEVHR